MQKVFVYFFSAFPFIQIKTVFHQNCLGLQFWINQSPVQNCFLTREVFFYYHEMFFPMHGLAFSWVQLCQNGQLYVNCKMEPSMRFHIVLLPMESITESGPVFSLGFLLVWQSIFQVCQCQKTVKMCPTLCGDAIFYWEDKKAKRQTRVYT